MSHSTESVCMPPDAPTRAEPSRAQPDSRNVTLGLRNLTFTPTPPADGRRGRSHFLRLPRSSVVGPSPLHCEAAGAAGVPPGVCSAAGVRRLHSERNSRSPGWPEGGKCPSSRCPHSARGGRGETHRTPSLPAQWGPCGRPSHWAAACRGSALCRRARRELTRTGPLSCAVLPRATWPAAWHRPPSSSRSPPSGLCTSSGSCPLPYHTPHILMENPNIHQCFLQMGTKAQRGLTTSPGHQGREQQLPGVDLDILAPAGAAPTTEFPGDPAVGAPGDDTRKVRDTREHRGLWGRASGCDAVLPPPLLSLLLYQ